MYEPKSNVSAEEWRRIMKIVFEEVQHMDLDEFEELVGELDDARPNNKGHLYDMQELMDLVEDWYNRLSPEDRYLLIEARFDEERAKTHAAMERDNNIE